MKIIILKFKDGYSITRNRSYHGPFWRRKNLQKKWIHICVSAFSKISATLSNTFMEMKWYIQVQLISLQVGTITFYTFVISTAQFYRNWEGGNIAHQNERLQIAFFHLRKKCVLICFRKLRSLLREVHEIALWLLDP